MITYPLIIPGPPATPGPNKANPKMFDAVGEFISPFSGSAQQQQNQDQHWELDLDWPEMTWAQFAPLAAFAGALHGKWGSFLWGPPLSAAPQGSGAGTGAPVAAGTDISGSNLLTTQAWMPGQGGVLYPGDYLALMTLSSPSAPFASLFGATVTVVDGVVTLVIGFGGFQDRFQPLPWLNTGSVFTIAGSGLCDGTFAGIVTWVQTRHGLTEVWTCTVVFPDASASGSGTLLPAATLTSADSPRLYQYVNPNPLVTDSGGNAIIDIFPCLREAPPAGASLILLNPQGTFRMAENRRETPTGKTKTLTFAMKCREAI